MVTSLKWIQKEGLSNGVVSQEREGLSTFVGDPLPWENKNILLNGRLESKT